MYIADVILVTKHADPCPGVMHWAHHARLRFRERLLFFLPSLCFLPPAALSRFLGFAFALVSGGSTFSALSWLQAEAEASSASPGSFFLAALALGFVLASSASAEGEWTSV